jgi:hypothetical protein
VEMFGNPHVPLERACFALSLTMSPWQGNMAFKRRLDFKT